VTERKRALRIMNRAVLSEKDKIALFFSTFHRLKMKEITEGNKRLGGLP
jgi:hypothetical protein